MCSISISTQFYSFHCKRTFERLFIVFSLNCVSLFCLHHSSNEWANESAERRMLLLVYRYIFTVITISEVISSFLPAFPFALPFHCYYCRLFFLFFFFFCRSIWVCTQQRIVKWKKTKCTKKNRIRGSIEIHFLLSLRYIYIYMCRKKMEYEKSSFQRVAWTEAGVSAPDRRHPQYTIPVYLACRGPTSSPPHPLPHPHLIPSIMPADIFNTLIRNKYSRLR